MTIRYTCVKCGSVLKIQEDRIGKEKHCPKCKASFVVPVPEETPESVPASVEAEQAAPAAAQAPAPQKVAAAAAKSTAVAVPAGDPDAGDADFDPVAFLMAEGGSAPEKGATKRAVAAASDQPDLKAARGGGPAAYVASDEPDVRVGGPRRTPAGDSDDDSADERLKRKPKRAPAASAAQTADEMLRVNASANAKELLTKTMEESRIRAAQMPEERKAPGIDYQATFRELGLRFAPAVVGGVLLIVFAYWFGNFMAGGGPELPPLAKVSGTVTKAGQPVGDAYVSFTPVDTQKGAGTAYTDENGYYELKYTEGVYGAVIGKNRVEVSKVGANGREMVPAKTMYGQGSNVIEVVEEGSQTIDIPIP